MLIHSAAQLLTLAGGPQRGKALGTLGMIEDGAVLIRDEKIAAVGPSRHCARLTEMSRSWMQADVWCCRDLWIRTRT